MELLASIRPSPDQACNDFGAVSVPLACGVRIPPPYVTIYETSCQTLLNVQGQWRSANLNGYPKHLHVYMCTCLLLKALFRTRTGCPRTTKKT